MNQGKQTGLSHGTQIALPLAQSGKLRVLALTGAKRWKGMPDVPTMDEQGLKGFSKVNWFGLWLPAGAPPALQRLTADWQAFLVRRAAAEAAPPDPQRPPVAYLLGPLFERRPGLAVIIVGEIGPFNDARERKLVEVVEALLLPTA